VLPQVRVLKADATLPNDVCTRRIESPAAPPLPPPSFSQSLSAERAALAAAGVVAGSGGSSSAADNLGGKRLRVQEAEIDSFMKDIDSIFGGT
jgi:hypothetical protein